MTLVGATTGGGMYPSLIAPPAGTFMGVTEKLGAGLLGTYSVAKIDRATFTVLSTSAVSSSSSDTGRGHLFFDPISAIQHFCYTEKTSPPAAANDNIVARATSTTFLAIPPEVISNTAATEDHCHLAGTSAGERIIAFHDSTLGIRVAIDPQPPSILSYAVMPISSAFDFPAIARAPTTTTHDVVAQNLGRSPEVGHWRSPEVATASL